MGLRTYVRAHTCVYVQSIYLVGGGLIIEANIPVQELEGQRGEGAYFREDTVLCVTRKLIKWTWVELFEINVNIEQELNFVVDNDSRLLLDAQEAKKVSERTVVR